MSITVRGALAGVIVLAIIAAASAAPPGSGDLADEVPSAQGVCAAVGALYTAGRTQAILRYALPPDQYQGPGADGPDKARRVMTDRGWREATSGDYGMTHYPDQSFGIGRIVLVPDKPAAWVFSTNVGSLHNPLLWVLESTPDGAKADHLLLQLGFEASGPFETTFVRFRGEPFAVTLFEAEFGEFVDVYRLGEPGVTCFFRPPGWQPPGPPR